MGREVPAHVWVIDVDMGGHAPRQPPRPGLLLEWRQQTNGSGGAWWEGNIIVGTKTGHEAKWVHSMYLKPSSAQE